MKLKLRCEFKNINDNFDIYDSVYLFNGYLPTTYATPHPTPASCPALFEFTDSGAESSKYKLQVIKCIRFLNGINVTYGQNRNPRPRGNASCGLREEKKIVASLIIDWHKAATNPINLARRAILPRYKRDTIVKDQQNNVIHQNTIIMCIVQTKDWSVFFCVCVMLGLYTGHTVVVRRLLYLAMLVCCMIYGKQWDD